MIVARHNIAAGLIFHLYTRCLLKHHFSKIRLLGFPKSLHPKKSILLLPNHNSWWDGFTACFLNNHFLHRKFYVMMLEEQLRKNPFFKYIGAYSIKNSSTADIRASLRYTATRLAHSRTLVTFFPQGELHSSSHQQLPFKPGLNWLLRAVPDAQIVPLSIRYDMETTQYPEISLFADRVFAPAQNNAKTLQDTLQQTRESHAEKLRQNAQGICLLQGRKSINERMEKKIAYLRRIIRRTQ